MFTFYEDYCIPILIKIRLHISAISLTVWSMHDHSLFPDSVMLDDLLIYKLVSLDGKRPGRLIVQFMLCGKKCNQQSHVPFTLVFKII